jgi:O-antigen ligase
VESGTSPTRIGWWLAAALLLVPPLVQGGTPRLPTLVVELGICGLLAAWALAWGRAPRRDLRLSALDALLGFLTFWVLFSTLFAPYYHAAEGASVQILCYLALYWCLAYNPSFAGLSLALGAVRVQAGLQSLLVLGAGLAGEDRPAGTFYNPNFLAGFLAVALLLLVGAQIFPAPGGARRSRLRLALAAGEATLLLAALLVTGSRGGVLALLAGLALLLLVRSSRAAAVGIAAIVAGLLLVPNPFVQRLQTLPQTDNFAFTRLSIWKSAWSMLLDHPWLGIGLGQFEYVSSRYAFPVVTHWAKYTRVAENAHCEYLQSGAELGFPGLLVALGVVALLAQAAIVRLRTLPRAAWGPIVTLLAATVAIAAQAAVDFPLHAPPAALLLVVLAAGLRLNGVTGPERVVSLNLRPAYAGAIALVALLLAAVAVRPVVAFTCFLRSLGAPVNLLNEKWALEEAPRAKLAPGEAIRLAGAAARIDFINAPYRRALGSLLFQGFLRGERGDDALQQALYNLNYAAELNPNQFQYEANLGQAMTTLARREPPGRERLAAALAHYRRAAALAPYQLQVWTEIGMLEEELGGAPAAEAAFRRAVGLEEYFLRGWFNLGTFYARHGRLVEAREAFERGAALAEKAPSLLPTTKAEADLLAVKPQVFYNELQKVRQQEGAGKPLT